MSSYDTLIADCEADIRVGQSQNVSRRLAKLNTARVPRANRLPLANICRRAGLYSLGLTLLARVVYPRQKPDWDEPTSAEMAEYGVLLLRSGAQDEALLTLQQVDGETVPETWLYRAFCHFTRWEFGLAVPNLENYLRAPIAPYAHLVGRVNLAYAYVECGMHDHARALLDETIGLTSAGNHGRLQSNCLALRAQVHIQNAGYSHAEEDLATASRLLGTVSTNDALFISKWSLILQGLRSGDSAPLMKLKEMAHQSRDWEAVREADFFALKIHFERPRFHHLLFGTPFKPYRERIFSEIGRSADSDFYIWGQPAAPIVDLAEGKSPAGELRAGRKCHQLLEVLLRDFYRPTNMGGLFSSLFPGEHFDIFSSPDRVYQILRRTRRWLKQSMIPAEIKMTRGFYRLETQGPIAFRVPLEREGVDTMRLHFKKLSSAYASAGDFSAKSACRELGFSRRTLQRLLSWGVENKMIERRGASVSQTTYRILKAG